MPDRLRCQNCLLQHFDGSYVINLGHLQSLSERRDCRLCSFVLAQLVKTRAPHTSLVFLKPMSESPPTYSIILDDVESDTDEGWISLSSKSTKDVGWIRPRSGSSNKLDRKLVRTWLHKCHYAHHHPRKTDMASQDLVDLVLIDVRNGMLVDAEPQWAFATLSYVNGGWGGSRFNLDDFTKDDLKTPGVLFSSTFPLPAVIKDAIDLVRDNHTQKQAQIRQMDAIYERARFTIIALSAEHGNIGLPGVRENSRDSICPVVDLGDGTIAVARAPDLPTIKSRSIYSQRGWTFQEEVLSQQCIYLTDSQAYFTCACGSKREDGHRSIDSTHVDFSRTFFAFRKHVSSTERLFSLYATLLREYNGRKLTYDTDILDAFDGIRKFLSRRFSTEFIYGLPQSQLHHALFWIPRMRLERRFGVESEPSIVENALAHQAEVSLTDFLNDEEMHTFVQPPSWSWAVWRGRVDFQVPVEMLFSAVPWMKRFGIWSQRGILPLETSINQEQRNQVIHLRSSHREALPLLRLETSNRERLLRISSFSAVLVVARQLRFLRSICLISGLHSFIFDLFRPGIALIYEMVHGLLPNPNGPAAEVASAFQNIREERIAETLGRWQSTSQKSLVKLDSCTPTSTELMQSWTAIKKDLTLACNGRLIWPFKSWFGHNWKSARMSHQISELLLGFLHTPSRLSQLKTWVILFIEQMKRGFDFRKQFVLTRRVALSFFTYSMPSSLFSISKGQLYESPVKYSGFMTTKRGLSCDLKNLEFYKLEGIRGENKHPATAVYIYWGPLERGIFSYPRRYVRSPAEPENYAGVLFDYEDVILLRTGPFISSNCRLLLLSRASPDSRYGLRPAMWNVMLVKPVASGFWERVAVGTFREDVMLQIDADWECNYIRLA